MKFNISKDKVIFPSIKTRPDLHKFENHLLLKGYVVFSKKDNISEDGESSGNFVEIVFIGRGGDKIKCRRRYNDLG